MAWTYATLVQAIKDWTQYDETTFNNNIDQFILNTEERILFNVDLQVFRKNQTANLTNGKATSGCTFARCSRISPRYRPSNLALNLP